MGNLKTRDFRRVSREKLFRGFRRKVLKFPSLLCLKRIIKVLPATSGKIEKPLTRNLLKRTVRGLTNRYRVYP